MSNGYADATRHSPSIELRRSSRSGQGERLMHPLAVDYSSLQVSGYKQSLAGHLDRSPTHHLDEDLALSRSLLCRDKPLIMQVSARRPVYSVVLIMERCAQIVVSETPTVQRLCDPWLKSSHTRLSITD